ncbi:IS200/IS605 family transposase [Granulicella mallensis]|uniref:IS200/IS605 family transposase n=1 Tax=Granulicella mallensis TaxID=940614 RepID=UPI001C8630BB
MIHRCLRYATIQLLSPHSCHLQHKRPDAGFEGSRPCCVTAYLATVARDIGCECYRAGGVEDHVHLAIRLSRTVTVSKIVEKLKASSSKWIKDEFPELASFAWQRGYGAFSLGPSQLEALRTYIDRQEEHHRKCSFQEEYRVLLAKYGISCDERYVWD